MSIRDFVGDYFGVVRLPNGRPSCGGSNEPPARLLDADAASVPMGRCRTCRESVPLHQSGAGQSLAVPHAAAERNPA
jgi:hypothetical protein